MRSYLGDLYEPVRLMVDINNQDAIQARVPFVLNIK